MKLIDADKLMENKFKNDISYNAFCNLVKRQPSIDAVPVRHGRWIDETFEPWGLVYHPYKCDQCGEHSEADSNYCPNCGARMDKTVDERREE